MPQTIAFLILFQLFFAMTSSCAADELRRMQAAAIESGSSPAVHWGWDPLRYTQWGSHSNRLIPVYTYGTAGQGTGVDIRHYLGERSAYRSERGLVRLFGRIPAETLNEAAEYMDQTNVFDIQLAGLESGKRHIFLVVFDGLDWQTTRAAAIYNTGRVDYSSGRGNGTHFQDYMANGTSQFGFMVTSPYSDAAKVDVDQQIIVGPGTGLKGGYDPKQGGASPWEAPGRPRYLVSKHDQPEDDDAQHDASQPAEEPTLHAYADSSSSATGMTAGIKTYNNAVLVDPSGRQVVSIAHRAQLGGMAVGAVSSVPISHATPATAYAHNVSRNDYQDLTRDLLGQRSISHPVQPLAGLDVLIGGGYGVVRWQDKAQGTNFIPGNAYLSELDLAAIDANHGGRYVVAMRTRGCDGRSQLMGAAERAVQSRKRLFGFFGVSGDAKGHLPFATANGDFEPVLGREKVAEEYDEDDISENPTLAHMVEAALKVLERDEDGFWLMVEAGDVDWANHDNNLDNSVGAVRSGDRAVKVITDWVEKHSSWEESLMILTGDHGHLLVLADPSTLIGPRAELAPACRIVGRRR